MEIIPVLCLKSIHSKKSHFQASEDQPTDSGDLGGSLIISQTGTDLLHSVQDMRGVAAFQGFHPITKLVKLDKFPMFNS